MKNLPDSLVLSAYAAPASFTVGLLMAWLAFTPIPPDSMAIFAACLGLLIILMAGHMDLTNPSARRFDGWM